MFTIQIQDEDHLKELARLAEVAIEKAEEELKNFPRRVQNAKTIIDLSRIANELANHEKEIGMEKNLFDKILEGHLDHLVDEKVKQAKHLLENTEAERKIWEDRVRWWKGIQDQIKNQIVHDERGV